MRLAGDPAQGWAFLVEPELGVGAASRDRHSPCRGNDRTPKGRDAKRLGGADGAGERDPTNGRGPPKPCANLFAKYRTTSIRLARPLVRWSDSDSVLKDFRWGWLGGRTPS